MGPQEMAVSENHYFCDYFSSRPCMLKSEGVPHGDLRAYLESPEQRSLYSRSPCRYQCDSVPWVVQHAFSSVAFRITASLPPRFGSSFVPSQGVPRFVEYMYGATPVRNGFTGIAKYKASPGNPKVFIQGLPTGDTSQLGRSEGL